MNPTMIHFNKTLRFSVIALVLLLGGSLQAVAQGSFYFSKDTIRLDMLVHPSDTTPLFEEAAYAYTTLPSITLEWKVEVEGVPNKWQYQVCDFAQCYGKTSLKDGQVKVSPKFSKDTAGLIKPGLIPKGVHGTGSMKIIVWNADSTDDVDTLVVIYDAVLSIRNQWQQATEVYPNPVQDILQVNLGDDRTELAEVRIVDALGRSQEPSFVQNDAWLRVNTAGLEKGNYLIQSITTDGSVVYGRFTKI